MGLLNLFSKKEPEELIKLPSGSFTIDADGSYLASTVPRSFPEKYMKEISQNVLTTFGAAKKAGVPLSEIVINYSVFKITARELRGGAIIFLAANTASNS